MTDQARAAAELAARASYGRLLAFLTVRSRDLAAAEDALADAFRAALETWPRDGVPDRPEAWLLTAARRRIANAARHAGVTRDAAATLALIAEEAAAARGPDVPDVRLRLLFTCAHPAIDPAARTPLMLQAVLGLDAARIASAFLVAPATMGQRLVRAKGRIRDAGIGFAPPEPAELPGRLDCVLEAVYAAYGAGWADAAGADPADLAEEAIFLARLVADLLPGEPEARGLLALILHCEARRPARRDAAGAFVPVSEQDPSRWSPTLIAEAEALLREAAAVARPGRFQLEAAIQSAHAWRATGGVTDWTAIVGLYDALLTVAPTLGAAVARAASLGQAQGADAALAALAALADRGQHYQPWWAAQAHWQAARGDAGAAASYQRAIGLAGDPAVRAFLAARRGLLRDRPLATQDAWPPTTTC